MIPLFVRHPPPWKLRPCASTRHDMGDLIVDANGNTVVDCDDACPVVLEMYRAIEPMLTLLYGETFTCFPSIAVDAPEEQHLLGNLLSDIHKDCGQYLTEHGWAKASSDAHGVIRDMRMQIHDHGDEEDIL